MSVKNIIRGLQKQVRRTERDATVAAISQIMDELSAEASGSSIANHNTNDLESLFSDAAIDLDASQSEATPMTNIELVMATPTSGER
ncbi:MULTISPECIES: hypothetical protein [Pseudomonas]|uniref:Uncharacterized protein n=1 Tax=Pseudomonas putida TaxID=303 RepID=A0AAW5HPL8_PSEPU|nr:MULTISPECIES: hypothetical protein [Pseudomonas]MCO1622781.1 hypothetical protein [Pseudomonas putida]